MRLSGYRTESRLLLSYHAGLARHNILKGRAWTSPYRALPYHAVPTGLPPLCLIVLLILKINCCQRIPLSEWNGSRHELPSNILNTI